MKATKATNKNWYLYEDKIQWKNQFLPLVKPISIIDLKMITDSKMWDTWDTWNFYKDFLFWLLERLYLNKLDGFAFLLRMQNFIFQDKKIWKDYENTVLIAEDELLSKTF